MSLGNKIRERREYLGMTQEELAHAIGYKSRASINKIELGSRYLKQSKIKEIADILKINPSELMGWEECENQELLEKYKKLNEEEKMRINEYLDAILANKTFEIAKDNID